MTFWPQIDGNARMTAHQKQQVSRATEKGLGILCGGPGVGKSFCLAEIAKGICTNYGADQLAVACPTGKAAVRISELMSNCGIPVKARTIHSLLGIGSSSDGLGFRHSENNPLSQQFFLLDETSMIDTSLACAFMMACPQGAHVLWTGDPNQLPPVGHGAPLRDLIAAGVPYGELTEIKRNSGGIVEACQMIREGRPWNYGDNLIGLDCRDQMTGLLATIRQAADAGLDPIWDVQPVVAVNAKSPLSRKAVNEFLQAELNVASRDRPRGQSFAIREKIVNTKNAFFKLVDEDLIGDDEIEQNDNGETFVANGELAEVIEVGEKHFTARLNAPRRVIRIPKGRTSEQDEPEGGDGTNSDKTSTGCSWDLGYCLSVHKSQGSEWPWVIVLIDEYPGARMVCSREWLYTSISRAKSKCVLIGKKSVADAMCRRVAIGKRKTFLKELILKKRAERTLAEM